MNCGILWGHGVMAAISIYKRSPYMQRRIQKVTVVFFAISLILGCSPQETARVLGFGVGRFKSRGKTYTQVIDKDFFSTYNKTLDILSAMEAVSYRKNRKRGFIVASNFSKSYGGRCIPSTEVAIFFSEVDYDRTKVEVASLNFSLADFVAQHIFSQLQL